MQLSKNVEFQQRMNNSIHAVANVSHKSISESCSNVWQRQRQSKPNSDLRVSVFVCMCVRKCDWFSQDWLVWCYLCVWWIQAKSASFLPLIFLNNAHLTKKSDKMLHRTEKKNKREEHTPKEWLYVCEGFCDVFLKLYIENRRKQNRKCDRGISCI